MTDSAKAMVNDTKIVSKSITAFSPPKINFSESCIYRKPSKAFVDRADNKLTDEQKLRVATVLIHGGENIFPDPIRALKLLRHVVKHGKEKFANRAKFKMARLHMTGNFIPKNESKAIDILKEIAPSSPYEAGYYLAKVYSQLGEYAKSEEYYKRSIISGNPLAYLSLAYLYRDDSIKGKSQDRINQLTSLAENIALEEVAKGNCKFLYAIGMKFFKDDLNPGNQATGVKWLEAASDSNNISSVRILGDIYMYGLNAEQDIDKGLRYYHKGANMHDSHSLFALGQYWILKKTETPDNRKKGSIFLAKAAKQGHQDATIKLADYYMGNLGDTPQINKAVDLLNQAIKLPHAMSKLSYILAEIYASPLYGYQDYKRAFQLYDKAAKLGYRQALVKLGDAYKYGSGVERSPVKSYRFYRQAASAGDRDGMVALVDNYSCGIGKSKSAKYASLWQQRAIYAGTGKILRSEVYRLMLSNNKTDKVNAYKLLKRRVGESDRESMIILAHFYDTGIVVEKDQAMKESLIKQAIASGDNQEKGYRALGRAYLDDNLFGVKPKIAEEHLMKAIELGSEDAGYDLGKIYIEGYKDVPIDLERAKVAFRNAADLGNKSAMRKLAQILLKEEGKQSEAISLLEKSAYMNNIDSMIALVDYYVDNEGIAGAANKVTYWYNKAANNYPCEKSMRDRLTRLRQKISNSNAVPLSDNISEVIKRANSGSIVDMRSLAQKNIFGFNGNEPNIKKAMEWYIKAAKAGDADSMLEIGNIYFTGMGVKQSKKKARQWWQRAADSGNKKAAQRLKVDSVLVDEAPKPAYGH